MKTVLFVVTMVRYVSRYGEKTGVIVGISGNGLLVHRIAFDADRQDYNNVIEKVHTADIIETEVLPRSLASPITREECE